MGARGFSVLVLVGLVALGCGQSTRHESNPPESTDLGPITDLPFAVSGERLHAWWFAGDKLDLFVTFHDQELDVDCAFAPSQTSARQVCFPTQLVEVAYLDDACQEPVARVDFVEQLTPGAWVSGSVPKSKDECYTNPDVLRVGYQVGALVYESDVDTRDAYPPLFVKSGSGCVPGGGFGLVPPSLYALTSIDESALVSGPVVTRPATGGFAVQRVTADDGAEQTLSVLAGKTPCTLQSDGLCVPAPFDAAPLSGHTQVFADAGCSEEVLLHSPDPPCAQPKLGLETVGGEVHAYAVEDRRPSYRLEGKYDPATGLPLLLPDGTADLSCKLIEGLGGSIAGKEVTSELLKAERVTTHAGALELTQLHAPWVDGSDEKPIIPLEPGGAFVDEQGGACRFGSGRTLSGDVECRADGVEILPNGGFSDPTCETLLYVAYGADPATVEPSLLRRIDLGTRTWLSFKPYTGTHYVLFPSTETCTDYGELGFGVQVDRVLPLPSLELVER